MKRIILFALLLFPPVAGYTQSPATQKDSGTVTLSQTEYIPLYQIQDIKNIDKCDSPSKKINRSNPPNDPPADIFVCKQRKCLKKLKKYVCKRQTINIQKVQIQLKGDTIKKVRVLLAGKMGYFENRCDLKMNDFEKPHKAYYLKYYGSDFPDTYILMDDFLQFFNTGNDSQYIELDSQKRMQTYPKSSTGSNTP